MDTNKEFDFRPGEDYDVFICYSSRDDEAFPGRKTGWVQLFIDTLKYYMNSILAAEGIKYNPRFYYFPSDSLSSRNVEIHLQTVVGRCLIFILIESCSSLNSDWCRKELSAFCEVALNNDFGLDEIHGTRLFRIGKGKTEHCKSAPLTEIESGYMVMRPRRFYSENRNGGIMVFDPFGADKERFIDAIANIAFDLTQSLMIILKHLANENGQESLSSFSKVKPLKLTDEPLIDEPIPPF